MMPKLSTLWFENVTLSDGFLQPSPDGPYAGKKLIHALQTLRVSDITVVDDNLQPLIAYLVYQTADAQSISLQMESKSIIPPEARDERGTRPGERFGILPGGSR